MAKIFDRAAMTVASVASSGLGVVTLGTAITDTANGDSLTFAEGGVVNGDSINYLIQEGSNWELGEGTYSSTGPTLTRSSVKKAKAGGTVGTSAIAFTSAAKVYCVPMGWWAPNTWGGQQNFDRINVSGNCDLVGAVMSGTVRIDGGPGSPGAIVTSYFSGAFAKNNAANIFMVRSSTTPQALAVYGTSDQAVNSAATGTNWERFSMFTQAGAHRLRSEAGGTGTVRMIQIDGFSMSADPTTSDIAAGTFALVKNTTGGGVKLWFNDGGTMKSVALT